MNQIREYRTIAGLTQVQLAKKVGVSQAQIARMESGTRGLTVKQMRKYAQALDCEPWKLLPIDMQPIIYIERTVEMTNNPFKYIGYGIRNSLAFILRNCFNCIVVYPKTTKKSK